LLERSAPFFFSPFAPREGAEEGAESFSLPTSNTISMTRLLASRFVAEIARVYTSRVIRDWPAMRLFLFVHPPRVLSPQDRMTLPEMRLLIVAERLHIDQSTVSRRIDELEGELGYLLFNRNHQIVELTEAGRKFVEDARLGVLHIERAVQSKRPVAFGKLAWPTSAV
jgi:hypothetical protein